MSSPVIRSASSAPSRKVSVARSTSTSASRIGLPASSAISRPSSSRRALMPGADLAQDAAALVGRQVAGDLERGDRGLDGLLVLRRRWRCTSRRRASPASAGLATTRMSGDSTQRPARKIGCGLVPTTVIAMVLLVDPKARLSVAGGRGSGHPGVAHDAARRLGGRERLLGAGSPDGVARQRAGDAHRRLEVRSAGQRDARPPTNASPAPVVSTATTSVAGTRITPPSGPRPIAPARRA